MAQKNYQEQSGIQQGKPIPFIQIIESQENGEKNIKFELENEAVSIISQYKDMHISVLVIAGPQRTGKSYLANRILKQQKGFAIGPSTQPCTKGIWIWNKPVFLSEKNVLFILDTEGLNSVQRDKTIDVKIFSISMLLCSMFVYNNIGHIDEIALENISLVTKLSENICIRNGKEGEQNIEQFLPHFYWVLRDFSLDLKGKTPKEYLNEVLRPVPGQGPDVERKNEIRDKIRSYFINKDCECLVRPLIDEKKLARIEEQEWQALRPEFRQGVESFEKKVFENIRPKTIQNKILTCEMFVSLSYEYLQSINQGGVPTILSTLDILVEGQIRRVRDEVRNRYQKKLEEWVGQEGMPYEEEYIQQKKTEIIQALTYNLEQKTKHFIDIDKLQVLKNEFLEQIEFDFQNKLQQNEMISKTSATQMINQLLRNFQQPVFSTVDQIQPSMVQEKQDEIMAQLAHYEKNCRGSQKYKIFFDQFPKTIFDFFDKLTDRIQRTYQDDHNKTKAFLQQSREAEARLRKTVKDYEGLVTDFQKEIGDLRSKIDKVKRDFDSEKQSYEFQISTLQLKLSEYEKQVDIKSNQYSKVFNDSQSNLEVVQKLRQQSLQKEQENETLRMKIEQLENLINDLKQSSNLDENSVEVFGLLKELKSQLQQMDTYIKKKQGGNVFEDYIKDVEKLKQEKQEIIMKLRQEFRSKKEELTKEKEEVQNKLEKKIDLLNQHIDNIKAEMYDLQEQNQSIQQKEQQIRTLLEENKKFQTLLSVKQNNLDTQIQVLDTQREEIEQINMDKLDLEIKLGYLKGENSNLQSLKSTYPYVLEQSLKYILKHKECKLTHSLKGLQQEDRAEIKEIFKKLNISVNF